jgi:hypothetical protein
LKAKAAEYARQGIVPTETEAQVYVAYLIDAEFVRPRPGDDVIEFYARELTAFAGERSGEADPV